MHRRGPHSPLSSCTAEAHSQHSRPTGVALAPEQAAQNAGSSPPAATHRGPHSPLSSSPPRLPTVPQGAASPSCSKYCFMVARSRCVVVMLHGCSPRLPTVPQGAASLSRDLGVCLARAGRGSRRVTRAAFPHASAESGPLPARQPNQALYPRGSRIRPSTRAAVHRSHADKSLSEDPSMHKYIAHFCSPSRLLII